MILSAETSRIFGLPEGIEGNRASYLARTWAADRETVDRAGHDGLRSGSFDH